MLVAFGFQNEVLGRGGSIPVDFVKLKLWDWLPNGHATAFYSIGAMRRKHPDGSARISPGCSACWPRAGSARRGRGAAARRGAARA
jgi:hypothetical protein